MANVVKICEKAVEKTGYNHEVTAVVMVMR